MTHASHYTNPEMSTERRAAGRVRKRVQAAQRKHGNCVICLHRETTFGVIHCINRPDRRMGMCQHDSKAPKFQLDDQSLEAFRDAA